MIYRIENWSLWDLIEAYKSKKLDLNPPFQRQFIWSKKDQQVLLRSILNGIAIPNIFLQQTASGTFNMVDGQQRTRTILAFVNHEIETFEGEAYKPAVHDIVLKKYHIPVTIVTKLERDETIEQFYALVNSSGLHLNRPELKTAEFFGTRFMKLVKELSNLQAFLDLKLFTDATTKRMTDEDFTSELLTQLLWGRTDKKLGVDKLFERDVTQEESTALRRDFKKVIGLFSKLDGLHPIRKTRYKQRNDFYSLFGMYHEVISKPTAFHKYVYELLVLFDPHVVPSNNQCSPFQQYAFHCVSQSNSKNAREERHSILSDLFLNESPEPNVRQKQVLKFYDVKANTMVQLKGYTCFDLKSMQKSNRWIDADVS
jgi:hypothetical protein